MAAAVEAAVVIVEAVAVVTVAAVLSEKDLRTDTGERL